MDEPRSAAPLSRFLVELERPEWEGTDVRDLAARSRAAARELSSTGSAVRFLRAIFVPEDDRCYLLFEGESAERVGEVAGRAGVAVSSLVAAVRADAH